MKLEHICKSYGEKQVLRDFSLTLEPGDILVLMGPSGCGKTTLLHIIAGLIQADAGERSGIPDRLSVVFQEDRLCEWESVLWNLRLVCRESEDTILGHLTELGLERELHTKVRELSGGMKRRVALIRAVLHGGDLILDEAFRGLDAERLENAVRYVLRHKGERSILCATHDARVAELLGGRLMHMK